MENSTLPPRKNNPSTASNAEAPVPAPKPPLGSGTLCRDLFMALRKITHVMDLHSRDLQRRYGLTTPQLLILNEVSKYTEISVTVLARSINLSQATVTDILNRLVKNGLIAKTRSAADKRLTLVQPTEKCHQLLATAPPPLHERFVERFEQLEHWERLMLLASIERISRMMSIERIEAVLPFE